VTFILNITATLVCNSIDYTVAVLLQYSLLCKQDPKPLFLCFFLFLGFSGNDITHTTAAGGTIRYGCGTRVEKIKKAPRRENTQTYKQQHSREYICWSIHISPVVTPCFIL
jgi:outer membrane protease